MVCILRRVEVVVVEEFLFMFLEETDSHVFSDIAQKCLIVIIDDGWNAKRL